MTKYTGKDLYLKFGSTNLEAEFREFETDEEIDTIDQSAGADTAKTYLTRLEDGTAKLKLLDQNDGTALWGAVDKGVEGTLEWAPEGTAAPNPKHSVNAIVTKRSKKFPYDDLVEIDVDFQFSGAVTDAVYP